MTTSTDMEAEPKPPQSCDSEEQSHPLGDSGSVSGASPCSAAVCRKCGGPIKRSTAYIPGIYGTEDFGGDFGEAGTTLSEGPATLPPQPCMKCEDCGHSYLLKQNKSVSDS